MKEEEEVNDEKDNIPVRDARSTSLIDSGASSLINFINP